MIGSAITHVTLQALTGERVLRSRLSPSGHAALVGEKRGYQLVEKVKEGEWCLAIFLRRWRGMVMIILQTAVAHERSQAREVLVKQGDVIVIGLERFRLSWERRRWWIGAAIGLVIVAASLWCTLARCATTHGEQRAIPFWDAVVTIPPHWTARPGYGSVVLELIPELPQTGVGITLAASEQGQQQKERGGMLQSGVQFVVDHDGERYHIECVAPPAQLVDLLFTCRQFVADLTFAAHRGSEDPVLAVDRGLTLLAIGDPAAAAEVRRIARRLAPTATHAQQELEAIACLLEGRRPAAEKSESVVDLILAGLAAPPGAEAGIQSLHRAYEQDTSGRAAFWMGMRLAADGRRDLARVWFAQSYARTPDSTTAGELALLALDQHDVRRAERWSTRAGTETPAGLVAQLEILFHDGHWARVDMLYRRDAEQLGGRLGARAARVAARALLALGERDQAVSLLQGRNDRAATPSP